MSKPTLVLHFPNTSAIERGLVLQFIGLHPALRAIDEGDALRVYHYPDAEGIDPSGPDFSRANFMGLWTTKDKVKGVAKQAAFLPVHISLPYHMARFTANAEKSDGSWGVVTQSLSFWQEVVPTSDFVNMLQGLYAPKEGGVNYKTYGGHGSTRRSENSARRDQLIEVMGEEFELEWEGWSCNVCCKVSLTGNPEVERQSMYKIFDEEA